MGLGITLLKIIGPAVASKLFGGGGGGQAGPAAAETEQQRQLGIQSGIETEALGSRRDILNELIRLASTFEGGPIGELDIGDNPFLDEARLGALEPRGGIDLLRSLLDVNFGSGATGLGAELSQRQSENAARLKTNTGSQISGIVGSLIDLIGTRGGDQPLVDTTPAADIISQLNLPPPTLV